MASNLTNIPDASEMIARFASESWSLAALILVVCLTALTIVLYIEILVLIHKHFQFGSRRGYIVIICGLYPVHSCSSLLGICIPTAAFVCNFLSAVYLAVSLYAMLLLIVELFGGLDSMVRTLSAEPISLRRPPCCCCFICLPSVTFNTQFFSVIRLGILQNMVILLIFVLLPAILWLDQLTTPNKPSNVYNAIAFPCSMITMTSTMLAMYFLGIVGRAARVPLQRFHILPQLIFVQLVLLLVNIQQASFRVLTYLGFIVCISPLTCNSDLVIKLLSNLLIPFEMPILLFVHRMVVVRWIRSGTCEEQFDAECKYAVDGQRQSSLKPIGNEDLEAGAFQNGDVNQIIQDERMASSHV